MDAPLSKLVQEFLSDEKAAKELADALRESQKNGSGDKRKLRVTLGKKTYRLVRLETINKGEKDNKGS